MTDVADLIGRSIREDAPPGVRDGGMIKPGFNEELDDVTALATDVKGLIAGLEAQEKERTGISTLKVRYNKVFGYYIEIFQKPDQVGSASLRAQANPGQRRTLHHGRA